MDDCEYSPFLKGPTKEDVCCVTVSVLCSALGRQSQERVCYELLHLLCQFKDGGVVHVTTPDQWTVCLHDDVVLVTVLDDGALLAEGVELRMVQCMPGCSDDTHFDLVN